MTPKKILLVKIWVLKSTIKSNIFYVLEMEHTDKHCTLEAEIATHYFTVLSGGILLFLIYVFYFNYSGKIIIWASYSKKTKAEAD